MNAGQANNPTIPTTVGALLTEECTINPLSPLPSFLELLFVDVARDSGRQALSVAFTTGVVWLEGVVGRLQLLERRLTHHQIHFLSSSTHGSRMTTTRATNMLNVLRLIRIRIQKQLCHTLLAQAKHLGPEIQTLILFAIDYHCIHYLSGSTACEMMYGIKRCKVVKQTVAGPKKNTSSSSSSNNEGNNSKIIELTKFDKTISALLAALLPYCKERCDMVYNQWQTNQSPSSSHDNNNNHTDSSPNYAIQKIIKLYPYYHMIHEGSIFIYQFAYLLGYTVYWNSSLHAMGYVLRRMTVADMQQQQQQQQRKVLPLRESTHTKPRLFPSHVSHLDSGTTSSAPTTTKLSLSHLLRGAIVCSLSYTLISGWYSHFQRQLRIRRRRWIAGNDEDATTITHTTTATTLIIMNKLPIPPPPMPPKLIDENTTTISVVDRWSCPICNEVRINPTASTSGYVYCYKCIVLHIRTVGKYCPMTGMVCNEDNIVRLFEPTSLLSSSTRRQT